MAAQRPKTSKAKGLEQKAQQAIKPTHFTIPDRTALSEIERLVLDRLSALPYPVDIAYELDLPVHEVREIIRGVGKRAVPLEDTTQAQVNNFFERIATTTYSLRRIMKFDKDENLEKLFSQDVVNNVSSFVDQVRLYTNWPSLQEHERKSLFSFIAFQFGLAVKSADIGLIDGDSIDIFSPSSDGKPFPEAPPNGELYSERANKGEHAPDFIKRVYGQWLTGDFTRADLRKLDEKAEMALRNWERTCGRADINLPTLKERNDRLVRDKVSGDAKEAARLAAAALRRGSIKHEP